MNLMLGVLCPELPTTYRYVSKLAGWGESDIVHVISIMYESGSANTMLGRGQAPVLGRIA